MLPVKVHQQSIIKLDNVNMCVNSPVYSKDTLSERREQRLTGSYQLKASFHILYNSGISQTQITVCFLQLMFHLCNRCQQQTVAIMKKRAAAEGTRQQNQVLRCWTELSTKCVSRRLMPSHRQPDEQARHTVALMHINPHMHACLRPRSHHAQPPPPLPPSPRRHTPTVGFL